VRAALTTRFDEAVAYALEAHRDHYRKGDGPPYVSHLMAVASLVLEVGGDETAAIVAMLHDVVEDRPTPTREAEIRERFGDEVADAVLECSAEAKTDTDDWQIRKERYIAQMMVASPRALLVSLADKMHNLRLTLEDYRERGEAKLVDFNAPDGDSIVWYYEALADIYDEREDELPRGLRAELRRTLDRLRQLRGRPDCVNCRAGDVVPVLVGDPGFEGIELAMAGEVELHGCVIHGETPDWACRRCGHSWPEPAYGR
jgi:(p)ppGpp synthase/HD superfamily hydrolase